MFDDVGGPLFLISHRLGTSVPFEIVRPCPDSAFGRARRTTFRCISARCDAGETLTDTVRTTVAVVRTRPSFVGPISSACPPVGCRHLPDRTERANLLCAPPAQLLKEFRESCGSSGQVGRLYRARGLRRRNGPRSRAIPWPCNVFRALRTRERSPAAWLPPILCRDVAVGEEICFTSDVPRLTMPRPTDVVEGRRDLASAGTGPRAATPTHHQSWAAHDHTRHIR